MTNPKHGDLRRLDLDQLIEHADSALDHHDYERAVLFYREASRRAPMRQDLRLMLGTALDGMSAGSPVEGSTVLHEKKTSGGPRHVGREMSGSVFPSEELRDDKYPGSRRAGSEVSGSKPLETLGQEQQSFRRGHERRSVSAVVLGILAGLLIVTIVTLGIRRTIRSSKDVETASLNGQISSSRLELIKEDALQYRSKGEYAWAIEIYGKIPDGYGKNRLIAETYMEQGDRTLRLDPPDYRSTLRSYRNAVQAGDPSPEYGNALGAVYLSMARDPVHDEGPRLKNMELARKAFLAVLEIDPSNTEALVQASRVARDLDDRVLQIEMYRALIQRAPGTMEARMAKRNLRSMGFVD